MKTLNSLSNHVSGLSAETVHTSAHGFGLCVTGFGKRDIATQHAKSLFSNPLSFSASRGNPNSGRSTSVNNSESPLRLKFEHILVGDGLSSKWVNNLYSVISENKFGFNPDRAGNCDQHSTNQQFEGDFKSAVIDSKTVNGKKTDQQNRKASPYEITSGAESFIHIPIIAGESQ